MNIIKFPGLGLTLNVPKYLLQIGNVNIRMYAVCIVFGIVVRVNPKQDIKRKFWN